MLVFVFPGQGSQRRGMGEGLFDEVKEFRERESEIDKFLGYSIRALCLSDPGNRLKETLYTQPSLYIVNALHYYEAIAKGERPSFLAGHSVGEFNALLAAGAFDLMTGLRLVQKRAELMAKVRDGMMAAVVGLSAERIAEIIKDGRFDRLDIANYNAPSQTVISGPLEDIKGIGPAFEAAGVQMYLPLPVSAAFHSRYMTESAAAFSAFLTSFSFGQLKIPVISNVTARPYPTGDPANTIRASLVEQITHPVQWIQSIRYLISIGATEFKELGPGNVLTKIIRQIQTSRDAQVA